MTIVRVLAPAKLNLGLEVLGRRPDGFHELVTIFQTIDLCDTITVTRSDQITLTASDPTLQSDDNLVLRAARTLKERCSVSTGSTIHLDKKIPAAAGLGGASSDAAATLRALCLLWDLDPSYDELAGIALELGSDVPFFLTGGTAIGRGRGELLHSLSKSLSSWAVVATPPISIENKTATMFRALDQRDYSAGSKVEALAKQIEAGESILAKELPNAFSRAAFATWPVLQKMAVCFAAAGASGISLSGAGPSLFSLVASEVGAAQIRDRLIKALGPSTRVLVCKTISHTPPPVRDNR